MKVSINWLKEYVDIDVPTDELVAKIGAQLGAIEEIIDLGAKYKGIIVAKVMTCEKHPNADKLSVCLIDDGGVAKNVDRNKDGLIQVVCGAPNVRAGLLVAWLPPGATVPSTFDKEPFVLEARELRGIVSNGMLASANELALGDDHSGILEVDYDCLPGADFAEVFQLNDQIIDIENKMFTRRPDCFGILGVAREVAGILGKEFSSPEWYLQAGKLSPSGPRLDLKVVNELEKEVPRFCAVAISEIQVQPSGVWQKSFLARVGIKPVNNIVDFTNYYMHLTGQPLHAYDYGKVKAKSSSVATLVVRKPKKDEKLTLLGGKVIQPHDRAICIATDKELIGLGGVMGGADTEVDENTKNVILECANFDLYSVRKTSMIHGLFTDAVTRFSKGQSPHQTDRILAKCGEAIADSGTGGFSELIDLKRELQDNPSITLGTDFINARLGLDLTPEQIVEILRRTEFAAEITRGSVLIVKAPFWRTDIHIPEDVVEEVGRLYGYDQLPLMLPRRPSSPASLDTDLVRKQNLRNELAAMGANETLNYSFIHGKLFEAASQDKSKAFRLSNALSPELQYYRLSVTPSLLDKVHSNIKAGYNEFAIFELGKSHSKTEIDEQGLPKEFGRVGLVYAAGDKAKTTGAPYYQALAFLEGIVRPRFDQMRIVPLAESKIKGHEMFDQLLAPFDEKRSALVYGDDKLLGAIGEYKTSVSKALKLPLHCAGFELFLSPLPEAKFSTYTPASRYPSADQDICLRTSVDLDFAAISVALEASVKKHSPDEVQQKISCIDIFAKDKSHKQTTFRLSLTSFERTLTTELVSSVLDKVSADLEKSISAIRV